MPVQKQDVSSLFMLGSRLALGFAELQCLGSLSCIFAICSGLTINAYCFLSNGLPYAVLLLVVMVWFCSPQERSSGMVERPRDWKTAKDA